MSKRKPDVYLQDILESIQQIEEYLDGINENEFYQNSEKQDAVLRRLEIIGGDFGVSSSIYGSCTIQFPLNKGGARLRVGVVFHS